MSANINIVRGHLFSFASNNDVIACDATGAILLENKSTLLHFEPGWMKELCKFLDVDSFWLWRFWMGWDRNFQVLVENTSKGGHTTFSRDEVARLGIKLAKEYAK